MTVWVAGCATAGIPEAAPQAAPLPAPPPAPSEHRLEHHETVRPPPTEATAPVRLAGDPKHRPAPVHPQDIARAKRLLEKGLGAYRKGDYDKAEESLKQAMTLYPFFAEANLALGKIFLIRGSATLDAALINNARLMFEMAHTLDPNLRETDLLLELFQPGPPPP